MNNYYAIDYNYNNGHNIEGMAELRTFKGRTEIIIDITDISRGDSQPVKVKVDFNDGSPILVKDYSFTDPNLITNDVIKHTFIPSDKVDVIFYYPTVFISYANFKSAVYQIPIKVLKESFYSGYKNIDVAACQFISNTENSVFVSLNTSNGDILNLKLK
jgi:hypothetical protein